MNVVGFVKRHRIDASLPVAEKRLRLKVKLSIEDEAKLKHKTVGEVDHPGILR